MQRGAFTLLSVQREMILRASLVLAVALTFSASAAAQTSTWTGANGINWNSTLNWSPNGVPTASSNVVFPAGLFITTPHLAAGGAAGSLLFDAGATSYTLSSNAGVSLSGVSAITVSSTTTATQTINLANIAAGSLLFPAGQTLTITNNAAATAASAPTLVIGPNTVIGTPGSLGLVVGGTGTTTISGSSADSSGPNNQVVSGLTKSGPGTLVLSGNGSNLNGTIALNSGTLRLDYSTNTASKKGNGALSSVGGDLVMVPHASTAVTQNFASTALSAGHTEFSVSPLAAFPTLGLGAITRSAGATTNFSGGFANVTTSTGNTNGLLGSGPAFATFGGLFWANQSGGIVNTVLGTFDMFSPGTNTELTASQDVINVTTNSLRFNNSSLNLGVIESIALQSGGILAPAGVTGSVINGSGFLTTPGLTGEFLVHAYGPLSINARLISSGGLTKTGTETLTLGGPNTGFLSGPITVHRGGLRVTNVGAVVSTTGINFTDSVARGDNSANLTFDLGEGLDAAFNKPITYSAAAAGNGGLIKEGAGTLILGATNNYGGLTVNAGVLGIAGSNTASRDVSLTNGTLNITGGGAVTSGGLAFIGEFVGNVATANVGGGAGAATWTNSSEFQIGSIGAGTLNISGGGVVTNAFGTIGTFAGSTGTVNVGGGIGSATWNNLSFLNVGQSGTGILNITGGGVVTTGGGSIGGVAGGVGTVNVGGGVGAATWNSAAGIFVGFGGTGTLNLLGGGVASTSDLAGGNAASSVNFNGGALRITATDVATNTVNVHPLGGTIDLPAAGSSFTLGGAVAGAGTLTKTGPGTLVFNGTGTNFTGGIAVNAGRLDVPNDAALGAATLGAGPLGTIRYTASASTARTFNLAGGVLEAPAGVTLTLSGATVAGGFLVGPSTFATQAGTTNTFVGNMTFAATNLTLAGADSLTNFTNGGLLTKSAGSTATLTRFTNAASGRIFLHGGASAAEFVSHGLVTINSGGTINNLAAPLVLGGGSRTTVNAGGAINLGGTTLELNGALLVNHGTITGTTNVNFGSLAKGSGAYGVVNVGDGGVYAPGASPGVSNAAAVHFDSSPAVVGGPTLMIELAGLAAGTLYDQLHVAGQLSLGGTLAVSLIDGFTPVAGASFDILDWGSLSGTFSTISLPTLSGLAWNTSQLYSTGVLSVVAGLVGDYNQNGTVDAADYVVWRNNIDTSNLLPNDPIGGTIGTAHYNQWRSHFGQTASTGTGAGTNAAVPEPATLVLMILAAAGVPIRRRCCTSRIPKLIKA